MNQPNLLFVMTDQQRFDTLTVNGNPNMKVPHMDALAQSGANLQGYHTNCPVCVPSRCSLFTGRFLHSHRIRENYCRLEAGREIHLFRILKQSGYKIGYVGKNHLLDEQETVNFDLFTDKKTKEEQALAERLEAHRLEKPNSEIWRTGLVHNEPPEASRTWRTARDGIQFIKEQTSATPFALCVSFEDPHVPHSVFKEYFEKYPLDEIDLLPFNGEPELEQKARRWAIKYGAFNAQAATDEDKKTYVAIYRGMISWIDSQLGKIIQTLETQGLRENTLIVFTADHGDFNFEHGLPKKDLVLVNSLLRVPCLFSMQGVIKSTVFPPETLVEEVDVLPTILDLLQIEIPVGVQGTSFAPLLYGETSTHKDAVFAEVCPPYLYNKYPDFEAFAKNNGGRSNTPFNVPGDFTKSIRETDWRYIWYGTGEEELYDERTDPHELTNLAHDPKYIEVKQRLKLRLLEWNALSEDPLDPNIRRDLQEKYNQWSPLSIQPGQHENPPWKETIHMKLAKKV